MAESEPSEIVIPPRPLTNRRSASGTTRLVALLEVIVCSDFPTQIAIGGLLTVAGVAPLTADGGLSLRYVTVLSAKSSPIGLRRIAFTISFHDPDRKALRIAQ